MPLDHVLCIQKAAALSLKDKYPTEFSHQMFHPNKADLMAVQFCLSFCAWPYCILQARLNAVFSKENKNHAINIMVREPAASAKVSFADLQLLLPSN
jgi:hypothetical protein